VAGRNAQLTLCPNHATKAITIVLKNNSCQIAFMCQADITAAKKIATAVVAQTGEQPL
jgi:hypothetical protein